MDAPQHVELTVPEGVLCTDRGADSCKPVTITVTTLSGAIVTPRQRPNAYSDHTGRRAGHSVGGGIMFIPSLTSRLACALACFAVVMAPVQARAADIKLLGSAGIRVALTELLPQ